jgi:enolase-phosphatase E1
VRDDDEQAPPVRAVLLDVEGTTTPVSFVYDVLFPYARRGLHGFLAAHAGSDDLSDVAAMLAAEWSADAARGELVSVRRPVEHDLESLNDYLNWLMDRDRKSPALKLIQGKIWEQGYRDGVLRGQVFADVRAAFARWSAAGVTIAIYSSGSVLAQRLLFAHSDSGDLTPAIARYFDTSVGPKKSAESYARIATALDLVPSELAFVSDVDAEVRAAHAAGCRVVMCVRPGNAETASSVAVAVSSFDGLDAILGLANERFSPDVQ